MNWQEAMATLWEFHRGKMMGLLIGLVFGLMVVVIGFFQAVFVALCMLAGFVIGKRIDDHIGFGDVVERIFRER